MWHARERREKCARFWWENLTERDHSEDPDGRMGLELILGRFPGGVECIQLAQDRDQWWAVVKTVMNLQVLLPGR
jgi:hypothetical protein